MITSLRLQNFKSFADARLDLGQLTVLIGANASGKSNLRDAFRFLGAMGNGRTVREAVEGTGSKDNGGIRGGPTGVVRYGEKYFFFELSGADDEDLDQEWMHYVRVMRHDSGDILRLTNEAIWWNPPSGDRAQLLLGGEVQNLNTGEISWAFSLPATKQPSTPARADNRSCISSAMTVAEFVKGQENFTSGAVLTASTLHQVQSQLRGLQFLEPLPSRLREPSYPQDSATLTEHGDGLPAVLHDILRDPALHAELLSWLQQLTPMDVTDIILKPDLRGELVLFLKEADGTETVADNASDGTLRFLAYLAAMLAPKPPKLLFIEEIETGIHPTRLHLLLDLFENVGKRRGIQVVLTTHSPALLGLLGKEAQQHAAVVYRPDGRNESRIRRIAEIPNVQDVLERRDWGQLMETGWFDNQIAFTEPQPT